MDQLKKEYECFADDEELCEVEVEMCYDDDCSRRGRHPMGVAWCLPAKVGIFGPHWSSCAPGRM